MVRAPGSDADRSPSVQTTKAGEEVKQGHTVGRMICRVCKQDKDTSQFTSQGGRRQRRECRTCDNHARRERKFGMTRQEYERRYEAQGGKCGICQRPQAVLAVDHCHKSGEVRPLLLCSPCNTGLGLFKESIAVAMRAAMYLRAIARKKMFE
jgi:hypothetical protein